MLPNHARSIRDRLGDASECVGRFLWGAGASVSLGDLLRCTSLGGRLPELSGRSVLIATQDQLATRSEEHTSELQSRLHLVCRLLLEKKKKKHTYNTSAEPHCRDEIRQAEHNDPHQRALRARALRPAREAHRHPRRRVRYDPPAAPCS